MSQVYAFSTYQISVSKFTFILHCFCECYDIKQVLDWHVLLKKKVWIEHDLNPGPFNQEPSLLTLDHHRSSTSLLATLLPPCPLRSCDLK